MTLCIRKLDVKLFLKFYNKISEEAIHVILFESVNGDGTAAVGAMEET